MTLDMFAVLFGGVYAILPIFADLYGVGPRGLGWLLGGAIGRRAIPHGRVYQAVFEPPFQRVGQTILMVVAIFGLTMIAFALSGRII